MKSVYIETTIPSFITARPSRDVLIAGQQAATVLWWENERHNYKLYISEHVIAECYRGDTDMAQKRISLIKGIVVLPNTDEVTELAEVYLKLLGIPDRAKVDCAHLATCVLNDMTYLLSWNCTHLGETTYEKILKYNDMYGLPTPRLITPFNLLNMEGSL